ncbi:ADC synthase [Bisporella sp. PMI_857]|nr:ADC synthase [Bisporella sp. PMI_857]
MPAQKPQILFIDAYDSFSNNIISLLETELHVSVRTIKIDNPALNSDAALHAELRHYAAVVCGPGPGHPKIEKDVGVMRRIWRLGEEQILPVLGICLGFQSLCLEYGVAVVRLKGPQHGMIRRVIHAGEAGTESDHEGDIFAGVGEVKATLYQSLCVDVGQEYVVQEDWQKSRWRAPLKFPELLPLAWVESAGADNNSGVMDERVLVAVRHKNKPFWALQYHPESICTNIESTKVIKNWFTRARAWNQAFRTTSVDPASPVRAEVTIQESLLMQFGRISKPLVGLPEPPSKFEYHCRTIKLANYLSVPEIVGSICHMQEDQIILESSNAHETSPDVRGRYSIIGLDVEDAMKFEYKVGSKFISCTMPTQNRSHIIANEGAWPQLANFLDKRRIAEGNPESPFWGGFMGYATYELGLEGIDIESKVRGDDTSCRPDLCFAWITRSLVIDHAKGLIYLQDISDVGADPQWMEVVANKLKKLSQPETFFPSTFLSASHPLLSSISANSSTTSLSTHSSQAPVDSSRSSICVPDSSKFKGEPEAKVTLPSNLEYESKVSSCQSHIRAGDSYELCLTGETLVHVPMTDTWSLYQTLRSRQPAPFASYLKMGSATLISASPERFLKYDADGRCELRPMKGTVRKTPQISTLADAIPLLDIPKEKAENLMIVDLVRHDLHSVCGSGNVEVPRLMVVEEYRSVFQMISIVEGKIPQSKEKDKGYTGLDVLAASLPPGSMTGAPKKRSCEILQDIEQRERGMYSGVVGYMDVGGRGDWSVTIRCMFKWDDQDVVTEGGNGEGERIETWHIGAGGAVTALSTPVGEREEMITKLNGTVGVFR